MKLSYDLTRTAWQSPVVAPALGGFTGGVRPESGVRRVDGLIGHVAPSQQQAMFRTDAATPVVPRPWSPPVT